MYKLRKAPKRDLYWVVGPDGKKHSKDPIAKDKAEAQKRVLEAAMGTEAPKRGKGKGETIKVTNPMGSRKAEKEAREKAQLEAYARKHEKELAELGIRSNAPAPKVPHHSDALFEPVLADCFSGIGEACRSVAERLGLVKPRRGRGRGGKKLKGGGLAEKIAALKEHVRSQYREGIGPSESPKFVDVAMEAYPFATYKAALERQSKSSQSLRIPLEELETGYVRRINELAHEYAADMAEKHLHPSQWRVTNLFMKPHVVYPSQSPSARQLQYRRSHPIAFGPVTFVATAKPEPKSYTTEGTTKQYLLERAAAMLPWSLARSKEINEGLPSDPDPNKGRPKDRTQLGRAQRIILHDRPTRDPSRFAEEGEFGPLPVRAAQEEGEPVLGRIFSAAEVTDTVAQSKALEGRMAAALARLSAADDEDELEGNGKGKSKSKDESSSDESSSDESSSDEETAKLSGGGHFKDTAKGIFARLVAARRLKPADRRRADNMLERALHKLTMEDDSNVDEYQTMADLQARLRHYQGVLARWQHATPDFRSRNWDTGIFAQNKIDETEKLMNNRQRKQNIVNKLQNDLTAFLSTDTPTVRKVPAGQSTTLLMDDIVNGMEMTDLDRMYYNENPTYFSRAELEQYNATRAQQGLPPQNPTNRGVPRSVHHYLAHVEGEEAPTAPATPAGTSSVKTTRRFGPFTKYILNPLKHLFVRPREEDFVNIRQGQRAVEERVGPAVAIQTVNNPLLGRGVSGGGPFKKKAKAIFDEFTKGVPLNPQDRRRADNIYQRALTKLGKEFAGTSEFPDRNLLDFEAARREDYLRDWPNQPASIRNDGEHQFSIGMMANKARTLRGYQRAYRKKEKILRKLHDDLNEFVMGEDVGRIPIDTTREYGPFMKYIFNPLKHLFVARREEDYVPIERGQSADLSSLPVAPVNPLYGRGNGTTLAADSPPPSKNPHHTDAELTKEDYRRIIRATLSYVQRYRVALLSETPDMATKAKAHKVVDRFLSRASADARHGLNYLIMTKFPIPTFTSDAAQNVSKFEKFLLNLQFPLGTDQEDMYTSLEAMGDTMPHRYEEDEEWGDWQIPFTNDDVHHILASGSGSGGSWFDIFRPSRVINEVTNPDSILRRRITDVSKGVRKGYSPSARKTIEAYGSWIIDMVVVRRVPVQAALHTAFELVTLGKWNAARAETNKDRLFHLSIVVRLRKGGGGVPAYVLIEKNEVVNVGPTKPRVDNAEEIRVQSPNVSLETFLNKALEANPERFFPYDAFKNNCQDFVMMVLGANGLLNNDVTAFVKQPIGDLLAKVPGWTGPVANVITDAAGIANVALEGAGKDAFMAQLKKAGISPSAYLKEVKRRAKKHQYPKVEFATDGDHKLIATDKDGKVTSFGKVGYGDHIIYSHLEAAGKVPAGTAAMKQSVFHKSHSKIKGDWKKDAYSANNLALRILW